MEFEKPSIGAKFSQLGYLFKHTFTIVGRDSDILTPIIMMAVYAVAVVVLFWAGIIFIVVGNGATGGWLLVLAVLTFFYKFFFYNRYELRLSRLVFDTACGRDATAAGAKEALAGSGYKVRLLALLDMLSAYIATQRGKGGFLIRLVLGAIVEIWDLVNHFLLPVFAIDKLGFKDGCARLTSLKDHVPETLAGVFGIDIMGRVVGVILGPIYLVFLVLGLLAGLAFGGSLPAAFSAGPLGDMFGSIPNALPVDEATLFNWLPLVILIFVGFLINAVLARVVTAIKVIYFTLFYTRIAHAGALAPDIAEELDGYLKIEE